jgi:hypothetical protein
MRQVALVASLILLFAAAAWAVDPPQDAAPAATPPEDVPAFPEDEPAFPSEAPAARPVPPPAASGGASQPAATGTAPAQGPAAAAEEPDDEVLPPLPPGSRNVGPTQQRFDPTEKVRADFPVSFPVDI